MKMNNKVLWSLVALFIAMSGALGYTSYKAASPSQDNRQIFRELRTDYDDLRDAFEDFIEGVRTKPPAQVLKVTDRIEDRLGDIEKCLGLKAATPSKRCSP
jgi:hypothetical protein